MIAGSTGGATDTAVARYDGTTLPNYNDAGNKDWGTASVAHFGACLRAIGAGTTATWTIDATCPMTDGAYWNTVPTTAVKVAGAATNTTTASVSLRFGMRTTAIQAPGTYVAPITFNVVAPAV